MKKPTKRQVTPFLKDATPKLWAEKYCNQGQITQVEAIC